VQPDCTANQWRVRSIWIRLCSGLAAINVAIIIGLDRQKGTEVQICAPWVHNDGGRADCAGPARIASLSRSRFGASTLGAGATETRNRRFPSCRKTIRLTCSNFRAAVPPCAGALHCGETASCFVFFGYRAATFRCSAAPTCHCSNRCAAAQSFDPPRDRTATSETDRNHQTWLCPLNSSCKKSCFLPKNHGESVQNGAAQPVMRNPGGGTSSCFS